MIWTMALRALLVSMGAFGRLLSFAADGIDTADVMLVIMELVVAGALLVAHRILPRSG